MVIDSAEVTKALDLQHTRPTLLQTGLEHEQG